MAVGVRRPVALKRVPGSGLGWGRVGRLGAPLREGRQAASPGASAGQPGEGGPWGLFGTHPSWKRKRQSCPGATARAVPRGRSQGTSTTGCGGGANAVCTLARVSPGQGVHAFLPVPQGLQGSALTKWVRWVELLLLAGSPVRRRGLGGGEQNRWDRRYASET